jgi:2-polyprenyl-3-methyl-5-hydroxy-6-metoxy-1,4-benzoquinol methylase
MRIEKYQKLLPRKRLLEKASRKYHLEDMIILDMGCGEGLMTGFLTENNFVVGADMLVHGKGLISAKKEGIIPVRVDAEHDLPFSSNSFDAVLCLDMVEHQKNWRNLINECWRIIKLGGLLFLSTPNADSIPHKIICKTIGDSPDHIKLFGFNDIQDEIKKTFEIKEATGWTGLKIRNHWIYSIPKRMKKRMIYNTFLVAKR